MKGVSGDNGNLDTIAVGCLADECFHASYDFAIFTLRERIVILRVFHLTDGTDAVGAVDNQVYLYGGAALTASPGVVLMGNGVEVKATDYLADMPQTDTLEGEAIPCVLFGCTEMVSPEMLIGNPLDKEVMMKQSEEIYQLVDAAILFPAIVVASQKVALLQVAEHVAEGPVVRHSQFAGYLYACVTIAVGAQQAENLHIAFCVSEQRQEESAVFALQFCLLRKEEGIDVVGKVLPGVKQAKIVGYATKNHICLKNSNTRPAKFSANEIFFGLPKGERTEVECVSGSLVQASPVVDDVAHHPRCGRTAHHEVDVVEPRCTAVPEQVEGMEEAGTFGVKARQFVDKHYIILSICKT